MKNRCVRTQDVRDAEPFFARERAARFPLSLSEESGNLFTDNEFGRKKGHN